MIVVFAVARSGPEHKVTVLQHSVSSHLPASRRTTGPIARALKRTDWPTIFMLRICFFAAAATPMNGGLVHGVRGCGGNGRD